jgi:hypothetical protein
MVEKGATKIFPVKVLKLHPARVGYGIEVGQVIDMKVRPMYERASDLLVSPGNDRWYFVEHFVQNAFGPSTKISDVFQKIENQAS